LKGLLEEKKVTFAAREMKGLFVKKGSLVFVRFTSSYCALIRQKKKKQEDLKFQRK
jgi:hypothetical protein